MDNDAQDIRTRLSECVEHLGHVLPGQAPIRDFVHHNTLHGFQHLPFPDALASASRLTGERVWLTDKAWRGLYGEGRIDDADLVAAMAQVARAASVDLDAVLVDLPGRQVTRGEVIHLGLVQPLAPLPLAQFRWQVEELQVLSRSTADVALWRACLDVLGIDPAFAHPESRFELEMREEQRMAATIEHRESFAERASDLWAELSGKLGVTRTLRQLLLDLTGEDPLERVRPILLRHLGAHLDQGLAPWRNPARGDGFYVAWKQSADEDLAWTLDLDVNLQGALTQLPEQALDAVVAELTRLGLPEASWPGYLERLALELPGWSGMFCWRHHHPGYAGTVDAPVAMLDYLAVRLILERLLCDDIARRFWGVSADLPALGKHFRRHPEELWVRHAVHGEHGHTLPEHLLDLIGPCLPANGEGALRQDPALWAWLAGSIEAWRDTPTAERSAGHGPARSAWPLFRLAGHLGIDADMLRSCGRTGAEALLGGLRCFDRHQRGYLWLLAYERHYREQILAGLAANHGRWHGHPQGPVAQLVFCMDDREEGMRRHLEEIAPELETLGGAAHFAVFQNHYGLDDREPTPLCPVVPEVIVPAHNVREVPKVDADETVAHHRRRHARRLFWRDMINQATRHDPLRGTLIGALAAPFVLAGLLWRSLAPGRFGQTLAAWRERFDLPVSTRLDLNAPDDAPQATSQKPRDGFTDTEQADRIGNYLVAIGLTKGFAPLVVIMGHGSNSTNNPHLAAYDCGACAGRHSGPNARLFCAMANRPAVRSRLAERGIHIPAGTWFVGAEHNTADDLVTWYDADDILPTLRPAFLALERNLRAAGKAHAQERCRRLFSAPLGIGKSRALRHVVGRRHDFAQPRPELGHVTNACAFIGRRAMSRGAYFDRRSFLISYDPLLDSDGKVLERHLLVNGAVGAGISLEYFFSTVNNDHFGCGSKVMHNIAGYFGVMQGAGSDLRTGLPKQMIEIHEPMRLLVVVEQTLDIITAVYQRQAPLQELVGNGWVIVAAKHPVSGTIHLFDPGQGWEHWTGTAEPLPIMRQSIDWFAGKRDPLPPVLLERPLEVASL